MTRSILTGPRIRTAGAAAALAIALVAGLAASRAAGDPGARSAAADTLVATGVNSTPPDQIGRERFQATISGQLHSNRKQCRARRRIVTRNTTIGGLRIISATTDTDSAGRFTDEFQGQHGFVDDQGVLHDGDVPISGGTVTYTVTAEKAKVRRRPGSSRSLVCRPASATVQIAVAPVQPL